MMSPPKKPKPPTPVESRNPMSPTKSSAPEDPPELRLLLPLLRELELDRELDELLLEREPPLKDWPPPGRADKKVSLGTRADDPCATKVGVDSGLILPLVDEVAARALGDEAESTKASKMTPTDCIDWRCRRRSLVIR